MKKFLCFMLLMCIASVSYAAKIYRADGTAIDFKRVDSVFAMKVGQAALKDFQKVQLKWANGQNFIIINEAATGDLPVYSVGDNIYIADKFVIWKGSKSPAAIAKKYNISLQEILPSYGFYVFKVANGDALDIAQKIVESGDGFAFPDMIREIKLLGEPIYPPKDKYYTDYQWFLQNNGSYKGLGSAGTLTTLTNADIRFDPAIKLLSESITGGTLTAFAGDTKVAIMDSGVDPNHPDLKNKMDKGWDLPADKEGGYPTLPANPNQQDMPSYSHGTTCAGTAAAEGNDIGTTGVCPWCGIYPVKALEGVGGSSISEQQYLKAYQQYVDDTKIVAVNCSFGISASGETTIPFMPGEEASHLNFLQNGRGGKGGVIVYASGNDGADTGYQELQKHVFTFKRNGKDVSIKVVSVAAGNAWDTKVGYSNFGKEIDVIAPSLSMSPLLGITTTFMVGYGDLDKDYTAQFSGTSAAAPVVTGAFGVIFSVNPELTAEEAVDILHKSSDKINPETGFWDANGHSTKFGFGRVNLLKAVRLAMGLEACEANTPESDNNIDDNCDGFVDEGFTADINTIGGACTQDSDCVTKDLILKNVTCLKTYKINNIADGYCAVKPLDFDCPDGTMGGSSQMDSTCMKDCNDKNPCTRTGYYCSGTNLGICLPECKVKEDCVGDSFCDSTNHCRSNPSEPGGPCTSNEDCKYGGQCMTQVPGGFCVLQCTGGNDDICGDGGAKCVTVTIPQMGDSEMCLGSCKTIADCRTDFGSMMKCHEYISGKEGVCFVSCSVDSDCHAEDAKCDAGTCKKATAATDSDVISNDSTTAADETVADADEAVVETADTDVAVKKKADDGCSCSLVL